jgi:hypothetical protein
VLPAGLVVAGGGLAALGALARRARGWTVALLACTLIAAHWALVLWALPDFERYKPIPHVARVIEQMEARPSAVGTYKLAAPSLVFYLRRHVNQMLDEGELRAFFATHPDGVCVMSAEEYEAVRAGLPLKTRVVASRPRVEARLTDFVSRAPMPQVLLVAADDPAAHR